MAIMFYTLRNDGNSLAYADQIDLWLQRILPFFALLVALLMVSRIPYPHLVNQLLTGNRSFGHVVGLVFALVAVMLMWGYSVPILCGLFVVAPPIRHAIVQTQRRRAEKEPLF
jgi:phosphatidylserine synthase